MAHSICIENSFQLASCRGANSALMKMPVFAGIAFITDAISAKTFFHAIDYKGKADEFRLSAVIFIELTIQKTAQTPRTW